MRPRCWRKRNCRVLVRDHDDDVVVGSGGWWTRRVDDEDAPEPRSSRARCSCPGDLHELRRCVDHRGRLQLATPGSSDIMPATRLHLITVMILGGLQAHKERRGPHHLRAAGVPGTVAAGVCRGGSGDSGCRCCSGRRGRSGCARGGRQGTGMVSLGVGIIGAARPDDPAPAPPFSASSRPARATARDFGIWVDDPPDAAMGVVLAGATQRPVPPHRCGPRRARVRAGGRVRRRAVRRFSARSSTKAETLAGRGRHR